MGACTAPGRLKARVTSIKSRLRSSNLLESLLVEEMADEADAAAKHEHPVKGASLDVCL